MNDFLWISIISAVLSQFIFPLEIFAYTYELDLGNPASVIKTSTEKITINNCDNNQAEPYNLKNHLKVNQRISFKEAWQIGPGLEISIPGIPANFNLNAELSTTMGYEFSIINETSRNLTGNVPAGVHKIINVYIKDEIAKGTALVYPKPSNWWERILPFDSWVKSSPYTAYGKRQIINITYNNMSCFAGKWELDWLQWLKKTNSWGALPIGGLAGGELIVNDNGNVIIKYIFSYFNLSGNQSRYSIHCSQGSIDENGLQGIIQPMYGSINVPANDYQELMNRYTNLSSVYLTLCGWGYIRNTNQKKELPLQIRYKTEANNRVIVIDNHEIRSVWYQKNE